MTSYTPTTTYSDAGYLKPFLDGRLFLYGVGDEPRTVRSYIPVDIDTILYH